MTVPVPLSIKPIQPRFFVGVPRTSHVFDPFKIRSIHGARIKRALSTLAVYSILPRRIAEPLLECLFVASIELIDMQADKRLSAHTKDLSLFGCFVETVTPFPEDTLRK
ncbi:MAG: hypothetical protein WBC04_00290 [Candidatus Acidiferrales bacterium]